MKLDLVMPSVYPVACHTDNVGNGSTFVAIKGQREDGTCYIIDALHKGASTIVIEDDTVLSDEIIAAIDSVQAEVVHVPNARKALAELSAQAANYPARKLRILAVTGTKGKTTSAFLLEHILRNAGYKTALLSTVKNKIHVSAGALAQEEEFKTNLTTQHPDYLHNFFALCVDAQVDYVIMEVAAQATSLYRSAGLEFDGLIFTNFDSEHAEFYPTMQEYFAAKVALIEQLKINAPLLLNADDAWVGPLARHYQGPLQFGIATDDVDYHATICGNTLNKLELAISCSPALRVSFALSELPQGRRIEQSSVLQNLNSEYQDALSQSQQTQQQNDLSPSLKEGALCPELEGPAKQQEEISLSQQNDLPPSLKEGALCPELEGPVAQDNNICSSSLNLPVRRSLGEGWEGPVAQDNTYTFQCPSLIGAYNAYNVLGVVALCTELGLTLEQISAGLQSFVAVPGRLERYMLPNGASCFIDYAHNPSSYHAVLSMMRSLTDNLIVVFGAGGARDKTKRPVMGAIATEIADVVVLTSDNPRTEDPQMILQDILAGIPDDKKDKVMCDLDREQAIKKAYAQSKAGSVIMLLGKGPDEYQIIGSEKTYFSEKQIVQNL